MTIGDACILFNAAGVPAVLGNWLGDSWGLSWWQGGLVGAGWAVTSYLVAYFVVISRPRQKP